MKLAGDTYAIHYFRYLFGFDPDGELRWAYSHPRVELVASEHTGSVIVAVSANGDVVAIDPSTGAVRARRSLGTTAPGARRDVRRRRLGAARRRAGEPVETVAALVSIARDRDARFDRVKELAVTALAKLPGAEVTQRAARGARRSTARRRGSRTPSSSCSSQRTDPASLPVLAEQLAVTTDYLAGDRARGARRRWRRRSPASAGCRSTPGTSRPRSPRSQRTSTRRPPRAAELAQVIAAMSAIGGGAERAALGSHLLLYHADDELGDPTPRGRRRS